MNDAPLQRSKSSAGKRQFKRCILHIGTEKTGSTAIQNYLINARQNLRGHGVLYPKSAGCHHSSQWEFVAAVHHQAWKQDLGRTFGIEDAAGQTVFRQQLISDLQAEFDQYPKTDTLVLSSEHFHSRLHGLKMIEALKELLEDWVEVFEIIVYFRRQDQLAVSFQSTRLKSSVALSEADVNSGVNAPPAYFAYDKLYENWEAVFGEGTITARLYDPTSWAKNDLVSDFCNSAAIPGPHKPSEIVNRSLNRQGFQFLQALNQTYPVTPGDMSDPARSALVREISERYAGQYYPISRARAQAFYQQFSETNERLRQMAFPDYPAPLFSEDFSDYPETAEPLEPDYSDAVEITMDLWRRTWLPQSGPVRFVRQLRRWFRAGSG